MNAENAACTTCSSFDTAGCCCASNRTGQVVMTTFVSWLCEHIDQFTVAGETADPLSSASAPALMGGDDSKQEPNSINVPLIISGEPFTDRCVHVKPRDCVLAETVCLVAHKCRRSKFVAHYARVRSLDEVYAVVRELKHDKKIANATHNMFAYRIRLPDGQVPLSVFSRGC